MAKLTKQQQYVIGCINTDGYDIVASTDKELVQFLVNCFCEEYNYPDNTRRYPYLQNRIAEWLMGLPSSLYIETYREDIEKQLKEFGISKPTPKMIEDWYVRIAFIIIRLAVKFDIEFRVI